ncbi:MAG: hypothetical protein U1F53_24610 [Burkholderiaceae bacterium]
MGQSLTWLAVRGKEPAQVLADLDAQLAGDAWAEFGTDPLAASRLRSGWYAVAARGADHPWGTADWLAALSAGAEVVACRVEEHTMFASAEGWRAGERAWCVVHDAQQGAGHLQVDGAPPPALAGITAELRALQAGSAGVDYLFEVPLKLAQRLTGFKHDEGDDGTHGRWRALRTGPAQPAAPARPWWKRW